MRTKKMEQLVHNFKLAMWDSASIREKKTHNNPPKKEEGYKLKTDKKHS